MATSDVVKIPSEDELWTLLQALLNGTADGRSAVELKGWRPELLYFPEEPTGHTVSPSQSITIICVLSIWPSKCLNLASG